MEQTKSTKKDKKNTKQKEGFFKRTGRKLKEFWSELKKITWPDAKTVAKNTGIVVVVVLAFFLVIWGFDSLMAYLLSLLVG